MFCWFAGEIHDVPLILYVPLLTPCLDSEKLCIAVDLMKGTFLLSLAQKGLICNESVSAFNVITRGQSNLTKSAHSPVWGHPRGSKFVPLNSWGRVSVP